MSEFVEGRVANWYYERDIWLRYWLKDITRGTGKCFWKFLESFWMFTTTLLDAAELEKSWKSLGKQAALVEIYCAFKLSVWFIFKVIEHLETITAAFKNSQISKSFHERNILIWVSEILLIYFMLNKTSNNFSGTFYF